ncbi:hypothetical protein [Streptomyces litchfieldiae]|uniref:Scaffolding protein n=1 Tax=Streptomyces litchfieldiae TaxID=3075543 RepID=A0ABU2MZ00_9ACTN|nr:hypothetical protein [Streptomyces sp. DSM 44938]MDT0346765.1 hypothetical protein [Streptomyces sp. DSM 44938]
MPDDTIAADSTATGTGTTPDTINNTATDTGGRPAADPNDPKLAAAEQRAEETAEERDQLRAALDAVQKALNPDAEGEQDPAALAAAVEQRDAQIADLTVQLRTARVELAAYQAAAGMGARADRLLNSRAFVEQLARLDPAAATFADQLGDAIKAAVEGDPELYRAGPGGPPRGGAEFNGPPAGDKRPATLHDAIAARMSG